MTDNNEIVKACKNCLHYEACKGTYSSAKGEEDILYDFDGEMYANSGCEDFIDKDLINRQKAEIENLKDILFDAEGINLVSYWHQQCKITENGCKNYAKENKNLKAEIERLQVVKKHIDTVIHRDCEYPAAKTYNKAFQKALERLYNNVNVKAEAYKEFAELLKQQKYQSSDWSHGEHPYVVEESDIDNILNELVGEDDE